MTIGDRISMLRRSRDLSQEELAEMCGVSRQAVSKWESEQSVPEVDKIITLSDVFSVTTDYILRGIEPLGERPERKNYPAKPFNIIATAIMTIGFAISFMITSANYSNKNYVFNVTLLMFIVVCVSLMIYALGSVRISRREQKVNAMRFARINIWIVAFVLLSVIFNGICCNMTAPVPLPIFGTPYNFIPEDHSIPSTIIMDDDGNVYDENGRYLYNHYEEMPPHEIDEEYERVSYYESHWNDDQRKLQAAVFVIAYMLICTGTTVFCTVMIEKERKGREAQEEAQE